jgi:hypothetical protein
LAEDRPRAGHDELAADFGHSSAGGFSRGFGRVVAQRKEAGDTAWAIGRSGADDG